MSMADYVPGGSFGGGYSLDEGQCAEKCVCSALDRGLAGITAVLLQIDTTLKGKQDKRCEVVDRCKQEIIDTIDKRFRGTQKTCEQCKADAEAGLAGTLDYAIACAGSCIAEAKRYCKDGSEPPCEEEEKPKVFYGYCNLIGGTAFAIAQGKTPLDPLATQVAIADTEEVALLEAQAYCRQYYRPIETAPAPKPLTPITTSVDPCDISGYLDGSVANQVFSTGEATFRLQGVAKVLNSISASGLDGINFDNLGQTITGLFQVMVGSPPAIAELIIPAMASVLGCSSYEWTSSLEVLAAVGMISKATGADLSEFTTGLHYIANANCRRKFLSPGQATSAFLAGALTPAQHDAHFAIEGLCPEATLQHLKASKSKLSPSQLVSMRHRKMISQREYNGLMRENGFIDQEYIDATYTSSLHVADMSSVLAMQTQGVMDEGNASKHNLDGHADDLYKGTLGDYLDASGITYRERQLAWRAHWSNPPVNTLYSFLHRSRSDDTFGTEADRATDLSEGLTSLGIDDYFADLYIASAYDPLTKRDVSSAYVNGVIKDDDLRAALQQTSYSESAIDTIRRDIRIDRRKHAASHIAITKWLEQHSSQDSVIAEMQNDGWQIPTIEQAMADAEYKFESSSWASAYVAGLMTRDQLVHYLIHAGVTAVGANAIAEKLAFRIRDHRSIKEYTAGTLDRGDAEQQMRVDGLTTETINSLIKFADDSLRAETANACASGLRSRYLSGEITKDETRNYLLRFGIALPRANQLVSSFDCAKSAEGRAVAVEKLCHWLYLGAISQPDFYDRLLRLGYSEGDAAILLQDCVQANTLRQIKEANKIASELASAANKQRAAVQRAQAEIDRNNARLLKARKDKAKLRAARDKQLLSSAERLGNATSVDFVTAMGYVRQALQSAQENYGLSVDESLRIIVLASEQMKGEDISAFVPLVNQMAEAAANSGLEPSNSEVGLPPSSNGSTQPSGPTMPLA